MIFHTLFVLSTFFGLQIRWNAQNRADTGLDFVHCLVLYGWISCLGLLAQVTAMTYLGNFSLWMTPIFAGWILAPFLAWLTSSRAVGVACLSAGFFLTPEEVQPPPELAGLDTAEQDDKSRSPVWIQALLSPYVQAVHLALVRLPSAGDEDEPDPAQVRQREELLREGPGAFDGKERLRLLWDAEAVAWLHQELWSRSDSELHPSWIVAQRKAGTSPLLQDYLLHD